MVLSDSAMIHCEQLRDRRILIITPDGPSEKVDFERPASEIDPVIASRGELAGVMVCAKSFPGWQSYDALLSHLKFIADHHRQIDRMAVVSDSALLKIMPRIAELKVRHFSFEEKDRALAWLETGR
jgi:hypothetical protein